MLRFVAILTTALALSACATTAPKPAAMPLNGGCEAMRDSFPITYIYPGDTLETVENVRKANSRFQAACP
jgi:hypothetical protein